MRYFLSLVAAVLSLFLGSPPAIAAAPHSFPLGGVNLTLYCQLTFTPEWVAKVLGTTATDWRCVGPGHGPSHIKQISVRDACRQQYNRVDLIAYASSSDPGSWKCYRPDGAPRANPLGGVDLSRWCKDTFGGHYKAKLFGSTAGSWWCVESDGPLNQKQISVEDACRKQYDRQDLTAFAVWTDPYSWNCYPPSRGHGGFPRLAPGGVMTR